MLYYCFSLETIHIAVGLLATTKLLVALLRNSSYFVSLNKNILVYITCFLAPISDIWLHSP